MTFRRKICPHTNSGVPKWRFSHLAIPTKISLPDWHYHFDADLVGFLIPIVMRLYIDTKIPTLPQTTWVLLPDSLQRDGQAADHCLHHFALPKLALVPVGAVRAQPAGGGRRGFHPGHAWPLPAFQSGGRQASAHGDHQPQLLGLPFCHSLVDVRGHCTRLRGAHTLVYRQPTQQPGGLRSRSNGRHLLPDPGVQIQLPVWAQVG